MAALNRQTNETIRVQRCHGKIAIEEAVDSPFFNALATDPPAPLIAKFEGAVPFSKDFLTHVQKRSSDIQLRLESMDQTGISYAVVSLTSPGIQGVADASKAIEWAKKTNDHVYDAYVKAYPDRFGFFACVPMQDPKAAAAELERAVTQLGAKGVLINGFSNINSNDMDEIQYLDHPGCEPFWEMLAKLDVPLYIHPRNPPVSQQRLYWDYPNLAQASYGFGVETAGHALRIMCSGILDRYPNVQIILGHCAEALPFLIHRIDHRMVIATQGSCGPHKQNMMYYLQNNFHATCAGVRRESTLRNTIEEMGEGKVMFSVDYPYESNEDAADWFDGLQMNENSRRAIASENAKRLLKIR